MLRSFLIATLFVLFLSPSFAANQKEIDQILKMDSAPFGVIFEVVEGDKDALNWAIPKIKEYAKLLKAKFPDIGIAVVSHGKEQFGLLKSNQKQNKEVHEAVKSLVQDDSIPVHICGTHASWYNKTESDFPDYVDVAPAGPTEINNYEEMGYVLVVMQEE